MSSKRRSPASARYLLARLRPLAQPIFWGPAITLVIALLFVWDYWQRPGELANYGVENSDLVNSRVARESSADAENDAIGADIDNLDVLLGELQPAPTEATNAADQASQAEEVDVFQLAATQQITEPERSSTQGQRRSQPSPSSVRPAEGSLFSDLTQTTESSYGLASLLGSGNRPRNNGPVGYSNNANAPTTSSEATMAPVNQLQQALDRAAGFSTAEVPREEETGDRSATAEPSTRLTPNSPEAPNTGTLYGGASYGQPYATPSLSGSAPPSSVLSNGAYSSSSPSNYSPYGTAPGVSGPAPTVNNAYTQFVQPSGTNGLPNPGGYSSALPAAGLPGYSSTPAQPTYTSPNSFGTSGFNSAPGTTTLPQPNNSAFTTRSSVPGRTLGGGRIGTFSDP